MQLETAIGYPVINQMLRLEGEIEIASFISAKLSPDVQGQMRAEYVDLLKRMNKLLDKANQQGLGQNMTVKRLERYRITPS
jgi:hypothetical protein